MHFPHFSNPVRQSGAFLLKSGISVFGDYFAVKLVSPFCLGVNPRPRVIAELDDLERFKAKISGLDSGSNAGGGDRVVGKGF